MGTDERGREVQKKALKRETQYDPVFNLQVEKNILSVYHCFQKSEDRKMRTRALFAFIFFSIVLYFVELTAATPAEPDTSKITADESEKKKEWDVTAPLGPTKTLEFTTDEGTWMNLDVSPDGREIVFDVLGDIYIIPIAGGKASLLAGGPAFEVQPRFSPDGQKISYTSDKGGGDNILGDEP